MKISLVLLFFIALLQVIYAEVEDIDDELDDGLEGVEHYHKCLTPTLVGYLGYVNKVDYCDYQRPFGYEFKVGFQNNVEHFSFIVNVCRKKHKPKLPKKILRCALRRALKQCKTIGLPKCVVRRKQFFGRWKLVSDCLARVLRKCSNGVVTIH